MAQKTEGRPTMERPSRTRLRGPGSDKSIRCHYFNMAGATPQPPRMGTALTAFLRRYGAELREYDRHRGDQTTRRMIDSAEFLLAEAERLEKGRHG